MRARIYFIAFALVALAMSGCKKEPQPTPVTDVKAMVVGEWHCAPEAYDIDVYVSFDALGTFDHYQRIEEGRYRHYNGTWSVEGNLLSGVYSDGEAWGSSYNVSFEGDTIVLTATNASAETMTYTKESIPDEVKSSAIAPFALRGFVEDDNRWF